MDICAIGDLFKEWSEPICACATLILSIAVIVINRKVDAESKRTREKDAMLLQPSGISAWFEGLRPGNRVQNAWICNTTELPVYNVVATAVVTKGGDCGKGEACQGAETYRAIFAVAPPGKHSFSMDLTGFWGMCAYPVLEVGFMCTDGNSWIRRGNGVLERIDTDPLTYYGIARPCHFDELIG